MRVGDVDLSLVSDGTIRVDGGALYGVAPKVIWNRLSPADNRNRVEIGLNCLLIRAGGKNILADTGVGDKHPLQRQTMFDMKAGGLVRALRAHGLSVNDVDVVALTHLHFDHAGGCTRRGYGDTTVPTFPRATYLVQRQDWYDATHTTERTDASYLPEDFFPLEGSKQLEFLDGETAIAPNVWLRVTGGHTPGHQMVFIDSGGQRAACLGDTLPTPHHLPLRYSTAWDIHPRETSESKRMYLDQAEREHWLLIFGHGLDSRAGYLVRGERGLVLDPVEL